MIIKINEVDYNFKNDFNELTIYEYMEVQKILGEREKCKTTKDKLINDNVIIVEGDNGTEYYELIPIEEESLKFKVEKYYKLIKMLSNISDEILDDLIIGHYEVLDSVPDLLELLLDKIVIYNESSKTDKIKHYIVELNDNEGLESFNDVSSGYIFEDDDDWFFIPNFNMIRFQEWSDIETFKNTYQDWTYILIYLIRKFESKPTFKEVGKGLKMKQVCDNVPKYIDIKTQKHIQRMEAVIKSLKMKDGYWLLNHYIKEISTYQENYIYIYGKHNVKSKPTPNYDKLIETLGWTAIVRELAKSNMFNSTKGPLYAVQNAYFIKMLEHLNVERAFSIAEQKDYEIQSRQK